MNQYQQHRTIAKAVARCCGLWLIGLPALAAYADQATVYQCQGKNGVTIFSGTPCGTNAQEKVIDAPNAGTGSDKQGINSLAKQYDKRQADERKAAEKAAERAARQHPPAPRVEQKTVIENQVIGEVPYYDRHPGYRPPHYRPHPPTPPPVQYEYKNPGISGQFPGGAPGSSGSNWKPVTPPKP
ncbi:DUF4124 domain-containing protein [Halothiobacillus sp. DCM-1]|uniref:DUF4124 domain-containing protein n=1 Tax=Halothiobacillus sp. DCM-1 TaxID=3112558 RepID=UPI003248A8B5